jgi:hypothetical protein
VHCYSYGPQTDIKFLFQLTAWAKEPEVQQAWKEIASQHDLSYKELTDIDRVFGFADSMLAGEGYFIRYTTICSPLNQGPPLTHWQHGQGSEAWLARVCGFVREHPPSP